MRPSGWQWLTDSVAKPVNRTRVYAESQLTHVDCMDCPAAKESAPRQQRHSHMNDIIWRVIKRVQVPAVKEPVILTLEDNKRPEGTTMLPWAKGKPLAWDVTVPDTYNNNTSICKAHNVSIRAESEAESHIADTVSTPGAAAHQAA